MVSRSHLEMIGRPVRAVAKIVWEERIEEVKVEIKIIGPLPLRVSTAKVARVLVRGPGRRGPGSIAKMLTAKPQQMG